MMNSSEMKKKERHATTAETVCVDRDDLLSTDFETTSLNEVALASSEIVHPTFFNLLEGVSTHLQTVLMERLSVLELNKLAVCSRSLRRGAIATMKYRSLKIYIKREGRVSPYSFDHTRFVTSMYIVDIYDVSRNVRIDVCDCGKYPCRPWKPIEKLLYFSSHAHLECIEFGYLPWTNNIVPTCVVPSIAFESHRRASSEIDHSEVFVDRVVARITDTECPPFLHFVSPAHLTILIEPTFGCFECLLSHRGITSCNTIEVCYGFTHTEVFTIDKVILRLPQSCITFRTSEHNLYCGCANLKWTPSYVAAFVEFKQWNRGSRVIDRVQSTLRWTHIFPTHVAFGSQIFEELEQLEQPPQIVSSNTLDDDLRNRLQRLDGKTMYNQNEIAFSPDAFILHLTASDGRLLTIVVTTAWKVNSNLSAKDRRLLLSGFIDIFPNS